MLKICVCEDSYSFRKKVCNLLNKIIEKEAYDMSIVLDTHDPYELLNYCKESKESCVYFLDVHLDTDINGIELAEKIRQYDTRGYIIFVTTHEEMSHLTFKYKVEALDYIIKDDLDAIKDNISDCLKNVIDKYKNNQSDIGKTLTLKINDKQVMIPYAKIMFIETSSISHKLILHAENRQMEFYGKMNEIHELLDERFIRCHRSYLVNSENIKEIQHSDKMIVMKNDQSCFYSTRGKKQISDLDLAK